MLQISLKNFVDEQSKLWYGIGRLSRKVQLHLRATPEEKQKVN
jgi:hypothetical protein